MISVYTIFSLISTIVIPTLIIAVLIFRADEIINLLKLDKGFDADRIAFGTITVDNLFKIAVIVIGLFIIITNLPIFLHHTFLAFKDMITNKGIDGTLEVHTYDKVDYSQIIITAISLVIGFLMLTNYTNLTKWHLV